MSKFMNKKNSKLRAVSLLCAVFMASSVMSVIAACSSSTKEETTTPTTTKTDTQTLKNGNFEYFTTNSRTDKGFYYIASAQSSTWTMTSYGTSSVKSGIVSTNAKLWSNFANYNLIEAIKANDALDSDDDDYDDKYNDYNSLSTRDLPYADTYEAIKQLEAWNNESSTQAEQEAAKTYMQGDDIYIANPLTHNATTLGDPVEETDAYYAYTDARGANGKIYLSKKTGYYYTSADMDTTVDEQDHVLMIHNYEIKNKTDNRYNYGNGQNYTASTSISIAKNTNAKISLWVKTDALKYNGTYNGSTALDGRGAFIKLQQTIGTTSVDTAYVTGINTANVTTNNGWQQYTFYVQGSDLANTTATLSVGLGTDMVNPDEYVEGYAFFDDVEVVTYNKDKAEETTVEIPSGIENVVSLSDLCEDESFTIEPEVTTTLFNLKLKDDSFVSDDLTNKLNVKLTEDDDHYTSSKTDVATANIHGIGYTSLNSNIYAFDKANGISTANDILGYVTKSQLTNNTLKTAMEKVDQLPYVSANNKVAVMYSELGAAYTMTWGNYSVAGNQNKIISFWMKVAGSQATVTVKDNADENNTATFSIPATKNITDNDGWVECFILVNNDVDETKTFSIEVSYGKTTIKGTNLKDYDAGYVMMTNVMIANDVEEKHFDFTKSSTNVATLTFTEEDEKDYSAGYVDTAYGSFSSVIKHNVTKAANYTFISNTQEAKNATFGLINAKYWDTYADNYQKNLTATKNEWGWMSALGYQEGRTFEDVVGTLSKQPLLLINTLTPATNTSFGLKANSAITVGASSSQVITRRVLVSAGAKAYAYLVNDKKEVMSYTTPDRTLWYDDEGNILTGDPEKEETTVAYYLQNNGLYRNADKSDKTDYANLGIYTKSYKISYSQMQHDTYYDAEGNAVLFDQLKDGETYYTDASKTKMLEHYLVTSDGTKVFKYMDGKYYYIIDNDGTVTYKEVSDLVIAESSIRHTFDIDADYTLVADNSQGAEAKWFTFNFYIKAGSKEQSYNLEIWNGSRDGSVVNEVGSYVIVDYTPNPASDFSSLLEMYVNDLRNVYINAVNVANKQFEKNPHLMTLDDLKAEAEELVGHEIATNYVAKYYTFSLYDSSAYVPFNAETANDGETGYSYNAEDYAKTLVFLTYHVETANETALNMFVDYTAVDQSITLTKVDNDTDDEDKEDKKIDGSVWLLASSIILVIALLFAMASLLVRDMLKKNHKPLRRKVITQENKRAKFIRKKGTTEETPVEEGDPVEAPVEEDSTDTETKGDEE